MKRRFTRNSENENAEMQNCENSKLRKNTKKEISPLPSGSEIRATVRVDNGCKCCTKIAP